MRRLGVVWGLPVGAEGPTSALRSLRPTFFVVFFDGPWVIDGAEANAGEDLLVCIFVVCIFVGPGEALVGTAQMGEVVMPVRACVGLGVGLMARLGADTRFSFGSWSMGVLLMYTSLDGVAMTTA